MKGNYIVANKKDSLGDRMKDNYENRANIFFSLLGP